MRVIVFLVMFLFSFYGFSDTVIYNGETAKFSNAASWDPNGSSVKSSTVAPYSAPRHLRATINVKNWWGATAYVPNNWLPIDLSHATYLRLAIKSSSPVNLKIELFSTSQGVSNGFMVNVTTSYTILTIPRTQFAGIDLSQVTAIVFSVRSVSSGSFLVDVDDITSIDGSTPPPTPTPTLSPTPTPTLSPTPTPTPTPTVPPTVTTRWVTGYWADWAGGNMVSYPYSKIDWSALTHLTVALAYMNSDATVHYQGGNLDSTLAKSITAAAHSNGKKVILMLGGSGSSSDFATAVKYGTNAPQTFVDNIYNLAHTDGFDGIDIDWEGIYSADYDAYKKLATALRVKWPDMVLTTAIGWDQTGSAFFGTLKDSSGKWLFDQFNVMNYDAANNWPGWVSWFHNALAGEGSDHPSSATKSLTALNTIGGVPRDKIGMGIPFYGSAWSGGTPSVTGPRQTVGKGASASQGMDNIWTYKFIMDNYFQVYDAATKIGYVFDDAAGVPYISGGLSGYARNGKTPVTFLSYEDPISIAKKGAWVKANGYGGTIIWLINEGVTDSNGTNPLLTAVKQAFLQ